MGAQLQDAQVNPLPRSDGLDSQKTRIPPLRRQAPCLSAAIRKAGPGVGAGGSSSPGGSPGPTPAPLCLSAHRAPAIRPRTCARTRSGCAGSWRSPACTPVREQPFCPGALPRPVLATGWAILSNPPQQGLASEQPSTTVHPTSPHTPRASCPGRVQSLGKSSQHSVCSLQVHGTAPPCATSLHTALGARFPQITANEQPPLQKRDKAGSGQGADPLASSGMTE
jgi:hypothetical protein